MREYKTIQGDTWDLIAYKMYKDAGGESNMVKLIDANSEYKDYVILSAGLILRVPDIETPLTGGLPAWLI